MKKPCCEDKIWKIFLDSLPTKNTQLLYLKRVLVERGKLTEYQVNLIIKNGHRNQLVFSDTDKKLVMSIANDLLCEEINVIIKSSEL